jgi:3-polyprenyl-4-hydroxybenzoate decarboxylase
LKRLIIGITGASGAVYGIRLLELLRDAPGAETHLIVSDSAKRTILEETDVSVAEMGAVILPPMPAFYHRPKQIDDLINHTLARVLDRLGISQTLVPEWQGTLPRAAPIEHA